MSPLADALVAWQRTHGRHALPWQNTCDPYRVWLSEIMLQQTQVTAVLRYYDRFLARFPDVASLAAAPLDDVLALWSGLGYYSRARNLHRCAQTVVARHGGVFPASAAVLAELPGIGRSTAAAIASFCHDERVSILDGNVKRVLSRALAFDGDLAQPAQERALWDRATALLPTDRTDMPAYTQGLMDLGATVCSRSKPDCLLCPLSGLCAARASGRMTDYPVRTRKLKRTRRENWCLWLQTADAVWLQQRPDSGIWAGLWSLPLFDDGAFDDIFQLPHISGIIVADQQIPSFPAHSVDLFAVFPSETPDEMGDEQGNVITALAQRWYSQCGDGFTAAAGRFLQSQILPGRR